MSIEITFDTSVMENAVRDMEKQMKKLGKKKIKIGVLGGDSELQMIAHVHEYGADITVTPKMRAWFAYNGYPLKSSTTVIKIPERSFLRSGKDKHKAKVVNKAKNMLPDVIQKNVSIDVFVNMIGQEFAGHIQKELRDVKAPPNKQMTKERKGSSNPLIDTGRLLGAIKHEVEG